MAARMPDWRSDIARRIGPLRLSPAREESVITELAQHLDQHYADLLTEGVPEESAREAVLAGLDDHNLMRELRNLPREVDSRQHATGFWDELFLNIHFGLRMLRKNPGFAAVAILTLAIGFGANTAVFSLVDTLLLRPLYPDMERLLVLQDLPPSALLASHKSGDRKIIYGMSYPVYLTWKEHKQIFESIAAVYGQGPSLTGMGEPERLRATLASSSLLPVLGISPILGRNFRADEEPRSAAPVVLLSYPFWRTHFNSDRNAVGQKLTLNDQLFTIIGVLPENTRLPHGDFDIVQPLRLEADWIAPGFDLLTVVAKVRPGLNLENATSAIQSQVSAANGQFGSKNGINVVPLQTYLVGDSRPLLLILLGAVAAVLLITCANTANLLLAHGAAREKEIAIRLALGASRRRLVHQLLTESLLISFFGSILGIAMLLGMRTSLSKIFAQRLPLGARIHVDVRVLIFTLCLAILTGIVFGIIPAFQASRQDMRERLSQGGRLSGASGSQRVRNVLVVAEIAFSLVLLAAAGLLLRSFVRLLNVDKGFDSDHVLTLRIWPSLTRYADPAKYIAYINGILERAQALPGVRSAGFVNGLPLTGWNAFGGFDIKGRAPDPAAKIMGSKELVAGDYFRAMGVRLLRGRLFDSHDNAESHPVAIIDQSFVHQYFRDKDPLGQHINFSWGADAWAEIVGVVGEVKDLGLASAPLPAVYVPLAQRPAVLSQLAFFLAVRTSGDPADATRSVREVIRQLDSTQIIESVRTMDEVVDDSLSSRRAPLYLFVGFGGIALFLASIGVYGVLSYYVAQRREEIGTRLALGAQRSDILRLILGHAGKLIAAGLVGGTLVTLGAARTLNSLLYGTKPTDGTTLLAVSVVLGMVALLACGVPVFRATRVDPQVVLRSE